MAVVEKTIGQMLANESENAFDEVAVVPEPLPSANGVDTTSVAEPIAAPVVEPPVEVPSPDTNSSDFDIPDDTPIAEGVAVQQPADWKTILKTVDKKELLKELDIPELDDFDKEFVKYRKNGGDPYNYLAAKAQDWTRVGDIDIVMDGLKRENPNLTAEELKVLIDRKYNQNELADEDEKRYGAISLKNDAYKIRQQRINEQKSFTIPAVAQPEQAEALRQVMEQQAQLKQQSEQLVQYVTEHEATKKLLTDKRVTFDAGNGVSFNFNVKNPQALMNAVVDTNAGAKDIQTPDGKLDVGKLYMARLFLKNPQKVINDLINYGKTLKVDEQIAEGQNAGLPSGTPSVAAQASEQELWKKPSEGTIGTLMRS